jgi:hypothetical protein
MANFAYQVSNNSYQGAGVFAYQGGIGVLITPSGGTSRKKRLKNLKRFKERKEPIPEVAREIYVELPIDVPRETLEQVLTNMREAEFDFKEQEEEDEMLVLTFVSKILQ